MPFDPTPEQDHALELFKTGDTLAINAYAGSGKTSTLQLLAEAAAGRGGQYVAFNKSIVTEAGQKFPRYVACNTAHSLAFRAFGRQMAHRLNGPRMKSLEIARKLGVEPFYFEVDGQRKSLAAGFLAGVVMRAITKFCQTADPEPTRWHVPFQPGLDAPGGYPANNRALADQLLPAVRKAWSDLSSQDGVLPYRHDHYLKSWQLGGPFIPADFILFDEAQDANPVMAAIVDEQTHAQRVYVGDSFQQIYSFTGAVNTLQKLEAAQRAALTQSFRFGPAIADLANVVLDELGADEPLRGFDAVASSVGPCSTPDAILTRTNARSVNVLLTAIREGKRPHLVGGGKEVLSFARAVDDLSRDGRTSYPDLACFQSWGEVQEYVEQDPQGSELSLMVKLIEEFGTSTIVEALDRMPSEKVAGLVISTAHKAKGREWHRVQLASDFQDPTKRPARPGADPDAGPNEEELRLLYVAVTRGQHEVDVEAVSYFTSRRGDAEPEEPALAVLGPADETPARQWYDTATGAPIPDPTLPALTAANGEYAGEER